MCTALFVLNTADTSCYSPNSQNHQELYASNVGDAKSCVSWEDEKAIKSLVTGEFTVDDVYVEGEWHYPSGAFHGAEGGPC